MTRDRARLPVDLPRISLPKTRVPFGLKFRLQ